MTESPQLAVRLYHGSAPVIWQLITHRSAAITNLDVTSHSVLKSYSSYSASRFSKALIFIN